MRVKALTRLTATLSLVALLMSVTGAVATWTFSETSPSGLESGFGIALNGFYWEGVELMPDDVEGGESHVYLVQRLVEATDVGLNNPSSHLNEVIADRLASGLDNASSVAPTKGGNLKPIFDTSETALLDFMIHIHLDDNGNPSSYEVYTFATQNKADVGTVVSPVFKTLIEKKNGEFVAVRTYVGTAKTMKYEAAQGSGKTLTVDPHSWVKSTATA